MNKILNSLLFTSPNFSSLLFFSSLLLSSPSSLLFSSLLSSSPRLFYSLLFSFPLFSFLPSSLLFFSLLFSPLHLSSLLFSSLHPSLLFSSLPLLFIYSLLFLFCCLFPHNSSHLPLTKHCLYIIIIFSPHPFRCPYFLLSIISLSLIYSTLPLLPSPSPSSHSPLEAGTF